MPRLATEELNAFSTADLLGELRRRYRVLNRPEISTVFLGPPGSGKSTLRGFSSREFGLCSVDGDKFLKAAEEDTEKTLTEISKFLASSQCKRGFTLSAFPRTKDEAVKFDRMIDLDFPENQIFKNYKVFFLDEVKTSEEILKQRFLGKKIHLRSGRIYSADDDHDEVSGEPLVKANTEEAFAKASSHWNDHKSALFEYFKNRKFVKISIEEKNQEDLEKEFLTAAISA
jgi:adenylate kinase family enzyme